MAIIFKRTLKEIRARYDFDGKCASANFHFKESIRVFISTVPIILALLS